VQRCSTILKPWLIDPVCFRLTVLKIHRSCNMHWLDYV
jgi:hypothetical protein